MNQYQKYILDGIKEAGIISFNQLKDAIVKEKKLMSDRTFRIHLKEIVESKKVLRIKSRNQHVFYTTKQQYQSLLKSVKNSQKFITELEKAILNNKLEFEKLSQMERANSVISYIRALSQFDSTMITMYEMTNDKQFMDVFDKILKLKSKILKLAPHNSET